MALLEAVQNGVVDCISSHHMPQDWDGKTIEFENAKSGMSSIETCYAAVQEKIPSLSSDKIAALFSINARNIFGLADATIKEGNVAELTMYNNTLITKMSMKDSKSKSANSPFWDIELKGKVVGTLVKGKLNQNS